MKDIKLLAQPKNPYSKLSGLITEVMNEMMTGSQYDNEDMHANKKVIYDRYNTFVETFQQTAEKFLEQAQLDFQAGHIQSSDVSMLINDQLERLQDQVSYMISSLDAYRNDGHETKLD